VAGYDAATVIMDALAGRNKGESLKDAIRAMGVFQGLQRKIVLDRFGDSAGSTYMTVVKNRRFVPLE